jgi:hypothetical protein
MVLDPYFIFMDIDYNATSVAPVFTDNFQIKQSLATFTIDNGSQNNLVDQYLVNQLNLPTTPHHSPYQLGWVHKDGPHLLVTQHYVVTFSIGCFYDSILCDVSIFNCVDLILAIPYREQCDAIYHAHTHDYHLKQYQVCYH